MTLRLRPHHLLCLLTYVGKGYSPAFIANYDAIAERLTAGEGVIIVDGPDDICAPLLGEADPHCLRPSVIARDARAVDSVGHLLGLSLTAGIELSPSEHAAILRSAFAAGTTRGACTGCQWFQLCSDVADSDYVGARFAPGALSETCDALSGLKSARKQKR